jgi:hypothetical protein
VSRTSLRDTAIGLGLLLSGGIWLSYVAFYDELGVAPSDVGIGFGQVLERSVGALVFVAVMSLLIFVFFAYVITYVRIIFGWGLEPAEKLEPRVLVQLTREQAAQRRPGDGLWVVRARSTRWFAAVLLLAAFAPVAGGAAVDGDWTAFAGVLAVGVTIAVGVVRDASDEWDVAVIDLRRLRVWVVGITVLISVLAFAVFIYDANNQADRVKDGEAVADTGPFGLPTTAISARPSRLDPAPSSGADCVLYLGASDGATLVYDPRAGRTERIPSGDVNVSIDHEADSC